MIGQSKWIIAPNNNNNWKHPPSNELKHEYYNTHSSWNVIYDK